RMKFWNIGGEGQFIMGAIASSAVALVFGDTLPSVVLLIFMVVAGMLAAGIYGVIVALLHVKFGTNETLMTVMLNYIALYVLKFFCETSGAWNIFLDPTSARPRPQKFPDAASMPVIKIGSFSLNISIIIAILICVLIYVYLKRTKSGYEISVVGDSLSTAKYAGMKVSRIIVRTMFISACLIGLAGSCYVSTSGSLSTSVTNNVGWTGVVVAWLSKLNTWGILITSVLISILRFGCQIASTQYTALDSNFADLLQGVILFIVLAADFFVRFKIVFSSKVKEAE
ncbi:MAG: ABC transporter permease, partial [Ruminococcus sp.]|nr:ABC transporter permease [Ruminococcus sp.]